MSLTLKTFVSSLHEEEHIAPIIQEFISSIEQKTGLEFVENGNLTIYFIASGGTEAEFKEFYKGSKGPYYLLTYGKANSLAASLEILSFLKAKSEYAEIIHGSLDYISGRLSILNQIALAKTALSGNKLGILGEPSDWLISSSISEFGVKSKFNISLVRISMEEVVAEVENVTDIIDDSFTKELKTKKFSKEEIHSALRVYTAFKNLIEKYQLSGLTIRCFSLLEKVGTTGCLALAILNSLKITACCEGDLKCLISMHILNKLIHSAGFQVNPANIDLEEDTITFAHCTVPLCMCDSYTLESHFESGIGVSVKGKLRLEDVTVFKYDPDANVYFVEETKLLANLNSPDLCRTQVKLKLNGMSEYFFSNSIGNHHVIVYGKHKDIINELMKSI